MKTKNAEKKIDDMPPHTRDFSRELGGIKPQLRLSDAVKVLKGNTARWLFLNHPEIKKKLWSGHLWNPSYFVATVSDRTLEQVEQYINNQKK